MLWSTWDINWRDGLKKRFSDYWGTAVFFFPIVCIDTWSEGLIQELVTGRPFSMQLFIMSYAHPRKFQIWLTPMSIVGSPEVWWAKFTGNSLMNLSYTSSGADMTPTKKSTKLSKKTKKSEWDQKFGINAC